MNPLLVVAPVPGSLATSPVLELQVAAPVEQAGL
jgi:hypothetical protein